MFSPKLDFFPSTTYSPANCRTDLGAERLAISRRCFNVMLHSSERGDAALPSQIHLWPPAMSAVRENDSAKDSSSPHSVVNVGGVGGVGGGAGGGGRIRSTVTHIPHSCRTTHDATQLYNPEASGSHPATGSSKNKCLHSNES